jgi:hypothetical protein
MSEPTEFVLSSSVSQTSLLCGEPAPISSSAPGQRQRIGWAMLEKLFVGISTCMTWNPKTQR